MIASRPVRVISLLVLAVVLLISVRGLFGTAGSNGAAAQAQRPQSTTGVVERVLDGDTVDVDVAKQGIVRVRLLGVDAPEIAHPGKAGECFGSEANAALGRLLPSGTRVRIVSDPSQDLVDVYGRWLRYLQRDGDDVGRAQIRAGAAGVLESGSSLSRTGTYRRAEQRARDQRLGMWASCP
ncbi:thermonuclease family protein [Nocardioides lacusdianchii]|uniref:thermonuclease family protein n=1 Tax=Nocardioides lacusdianchii TaxID=2783664 RepID=UPI001CC99F64|nr:thermonuclease family protein [Nocardioides lacusdianchii]